MVFRKLGIILLLLSIFLSANSQNYARLAAINDFPELNKIFAKADSFKSYMEFDFADELYSKIIQENPNSSAIQAYGYLGKADNYFRHRKTEEAKDELVLAQNLKNAIIDSFDIDYNFMWATYFYQTGQFDTSALIFEGLNQQLKKKEVNPLFLGEFLNGYGELKFHGLSDSKYSLLFFKRALEIWESFQTDSNHFVLGRLYYNLGNTYQRRTEYSLLHLYATKAIAIAKKYSSRYPTFEFICYFLFAETNSLIDDMTQAIEITKHSLEFAFENNLSENLINYAYNNLAEYTFEDGNPKESYDYNQILLDRLNSNENLASTYNILYPIALRRSAICLTEFKQYKEAEDFHHKSLTANLDYYGYNTRRYGQALRYYSDFLTNINEFDLALTIIDSSILTYEYEWITENDVSHLYGLILGHFHKGLILMKRSKEASKHALNSFLTAAYYMDSLRANYYMDETELNFSSVIKPVFENIISTSIDLFKTTQDSSFLEHIYFAIESNKYQILWQKIKEKNYFEIENVSKDILDSLMTIESKIENLNKAINQSKNANTELKLEIAKLKEAKALLTNEEIPNFKTEQRNKLSNIQRTLNKTEILIELFEGDSILYGLTIQNTKITNFQFELNQEYINKISLLKNVLSGHELSKPLKDQLLRYSNLANAISKPFNSVLKNAGVDNKSKMSIIVVPDGKFTSLPFETFLLEMPDLDQVSSFSELDYWVQFHDIHYSISAKWYLEEKNNKSNSFLKNITAIGPKRSAILLGAEKEIEEIGERFGNRGNCIVQNQRKFLKESKFQNSILHIASHAVIDSISSNQSYLHFGSEVEDSLKLFDYEISNLNIKSPLIVLNACETFKGKEYKGEGIYNLNQSFIIGGAESVISTLWKIEDNSAGEFMNKFYELLKKGKPINESVNQTKRSIIHLDRKSHPFYWAPFLYNGETTAKFKNSNTKTIILIIGISILLLSFLIIKLRNKQLN